MKIFLDTNVILDLILGREGEGFAREILEKRINKDFERICISFLTVADTAFVIRKMKTEEIKDILRNLSRICNILPMNDMQILDALKCKSPDFEDNLQIICAEYGECDVILTNNVRHFKDYTDIPVLTPEEFLKH